MLLRRREIDVRREEVKEVLEAAVAKINRALRKYCFPLVAHMPSLKDDNLVAMLHEAMSEVEDGLFDNEIESGVMIAERCRFKSLLNALNAVQGGKTGSAVLALALWCVHKHLNKVKADYIYVVPGNKSILAGTKETFASFCVIYGCIEFSLVGCPSQRITWGEIRAGGKSNSLGETKIFMLTSKKKTHRDIQNLIAEAEANGVELLLLIDEAHYADTKDGHLATMFSSLIARVRLKEIKKVNLVFISATPFPYTQEFLSDVEELPLKLGIGYVGFNFWDGKLIDPSIPVKTPDIRPFAELNDKYAPHKRLPMHPVAAYKREMFGKLNTSMSWSEYQNKFVANLTGWINGLLKNNKRGLMIRLLNDKKGTETLCSMLKLRAEIVIINFFGESDWEATKRAIKECEKSGRPFVVFVCGQARMSNRIPRSVYSFIDFSKQFSTATAAIQGLVGRASGYGKDTVVYLSEKNCEWFRIYIKSLGKHYPGRPAARVTKGVGAYKKQVYRLLPTDVRCKWFFDSLHNEIVAHGGLVRTISGRWLPTAVFSEVVLRRLEKSLKLETGFLLRIGQRPEYYPDGDIKLNSYNARKDGKMFWAFRSMDSESKSRKRSYQKTSQRQSESKMRGIEPHIHWYKKDEKDDVYQIDSIELSTSKEWWSLDAEGTRPTEKSMWHNDNMMKEVS